MLRHCSILDEKIWCSLPKVCNIKIRNIVKKNLSGITYQYLVKNIKFTVESVTGSRVEFKQSYWQTILSFENHKACIPLSRTATTKAKYNIVEPRWVSLWTEENGVCNHFVYRYPNSVVFFWLWIIRFLMLPFDFFFLLFIFDYSVINYLCFCAYFKQKSINKCTFIKYIAKAVVDCS